MTSETGGSEEPGRSSVCADDIGELASLPPGSDFAEIRRPQKCSAPGRHDDHASTGYAGKAQPKGNPPMDREAESVSNGVLAGMTIFSFAVIGIGLSIAVFAGGS